MIVYTNQNTKAYFYFEQYIHFLCFYSTYSCHIWYTITDRLFYMYIYHSKLSVNKKSILNFHVFKNFNLQIGN
jgi:hypothetical protein